MQKEDARKQSREVLHERRKQVIPIPDQSDRSLLRLAVLQHCLRLRAYSRIDLETESYACTAKVSV